MDIIRQKARADAAQLLAQHGPDAWRIARQRMSDLRYDEEQRGHWGRVAAVAEKRLGIRREDHRFRAVLF